MWTTFALGALVLLLGVAGFGGQRAPESMSPNEFASVAPVTGMCVFLYTGFEWVTTLGFRPDAYKKLVPISMPLGIGLNALLYVAFVIGVACVLPRADAAASVIPHVLYAQTLWPRFGALVTLIMSILATASTFNAGIMGGSKLLYTLARQKKVPAFCARSTSRGAPAGAVLVLGAVAALSAILIMRWNLQLEAAILGSALVCFVYAAMLLAARKLAGTGARNAVLAALMAALGAASLMSDPKYAVKTIIGALVALALALALASSPAGRINVKPAQ